MRRAVGRGSATRANQAEASTNARGRRGSATCCAETSRRASEAFDSTPRAAAGPDSAAERRRGATHSDVGCVRGDRVTKGITGPNQTAWAIRCAGGRGSATRANQAQASARSPAGNDGQVSTGGPGRCCPATYRAETSRRASRAFDSTPRAAAGPDSADERRCGAAYPDAGCV
jgi:hypothetical protein